MFAKYHRERAQYKRYHAVLDYDTHGSEAIVQFIVVQLQYIRLENNLTRRQLLDIDRALGLYQDYTNATENKEKYLFAFMQVVSVHLPEWFIKEN